MLRLDALDDDKSDSGAFKFGYAVSPPEYAKQLVVSRRSGRGWAQHKVGEGVTIYFSLSQGTVNRE